MPVHEYTYYAHLKGEYGSMTEAMSMTDIQAHFGGEVVNPVDPYMEPKWRHHGMKWFDMFYLPVINRLVFSTNHHLGYVGSGMAYEIKAALEKDIPVYELLYTGGMTVRFLPYTNLPKTRVMSKSFTSAYNQSLRRHRYADFPNLI